MAFIRQINILVFDNCVDNMRELAFHDTRTIDTVLEKTWSELYGIENRLRVAKFNDIYDMQQYLTIERMSSSFDSILLIDSEGNAYTDTLVCFGPDKQNIWAYFDTDRSEPFAARYMETSELSEECKPTLLYGIYTSPLKIGGKYFIGIAGRTRISDIYKQMRIESFSGLGHSVTIDRAGDYIVEETSVKGINQHDNFFSQIAKGKLPNDMTIEELKQQLECRLEVNLVYYDEKGEKYNLYFMPMQMISWYFITIVPYKVFRSRSSKILIVNIATMLIVCIVIIGLLFLIFILTQQQFKVQAQAQAKTDFLSSMSHEIRTPLNGLIGLNHLMTVFIGDKKRMDDYLKKSQATAQYLLSLVNDVLDMSKLQAGKVTLDMQAINLTSMLQNVYNMQKDNMIQHGVNFYFEDDIKYPDIIADETRVTQILMNLLSNAAKFTPPGGKVWWNVWQTLLNNKVKTVFSVKDTGCGISEDFKKHIFESFSQERGAFQAKQQGTGLGLAICYMLSRLMHAKLCVESKVGHGSCFTFELTSAIVQKDSESVNEKQESGQAKSYKKKSQTRILVAEDNDLNAQVLTEILEEKGFIVTTVSNGLSALEAFSQSKPGFYDIILMDVQMPIMNGYDSTRAIRQLNRSDSATIPIFACTANSFAEDRTKAFDSGMNDFLSKPIQIEDMLKKLSHLVNKPKIS